MWPRWIRAISALWVAFDSKKRKSADWVWAAVVLLLGPLLLPVYMTVRPQLKGEYRSKSTVYNFLVNLESFLTWVAGLAASAVLIENFTMPKSAEVAEVKRAEIKAGSILGVMAFAALVGLEKLAFCLFRSQIEYKA